MMKLYVVSCLTCLLFINSFGQSVIDPNDSVIDYNAATPPTQPPYGQIGKWVRTKSLNWNTNEYKCYIYKNYPFRLHFPKTYNPTANDGKKYPILIFFHGLGEAGSTIYDNENQLYHGGNIFQAAVDDGSFDGYVLALQSPGFFGPYPIQYITEILNYMIVNNKLDPFAISINGLSAGGQAVWDMTFAYPNYVAASVPMSAVYSSYANKDSVNKLKFTPVWNIQGGLDADPSPSTAEQVRDAMLNAGADYTYTEFPTQGHDTWDSTWLLPDFFPYLLRAYSSNPWALFNKTKFCPGDSINTTLGLATGFDAYQWRRNGNIISGAASRTIHVTQTGTYDARVKRNGIWSDWSRTPVKIYIQSTYKTPNIEVASLMSTALPAADGKNFVDLKVSGTTSYKSFTWKKVGSDSVYSNNAIFSATQPGYYIVKALPQSACSALYSPAFKVIDANGPDAPNAVKSLTAIALSDTKIQLQWSPSAQQSNLPFAFEVYRSADSVTYSFIKQVKSSFISFTDTGLAPKTKYFYFVRAIDSTAAARLSRIVSISTYSDTTAPNIPTNLHVTYTTPSTISIAWSPSKDNVAVDHYNIYVNNKLTNITKQNSFVLTSLVQHNVYAIYVKAIDSSGNISAKSNQVSVEPMLGGLKYSYYKAAVPWHLLPDFSTLTPTKTGVSSNVDVSVVKKNYLNAFMWQGYIHIPVTGTYTFETTSDDGSALWFNAYTPAGKRLVDNDSIHNGVQTKAGTIKITAGIYPVCIEYFNNKGKGIMSVSWACKALFGDTVQRPIADSFFNGNFVNKGAVPALPGKLTAAGKAYNKIKLTWQDNSNNETGFEIYRSGILSGYYKIVGTVGANTTAFTDSALYPSKKYYYKVQAINLYGNSGLSSIDSATTFNMPASPDAPSNFKAIAVSSSKIKLSWNTVSNATGYELQRSIGNSSRYVLLATLAASTVSYTDTDLNSNLIHYYKLKAMGNGGTFSAKTIASATTENNPPVISKLNTIKVPHDFTTTIPLTATDADGDALIFKAKKLPAFASIIDYGNDSASLVIHPSQSNLGTYKNLNIIVKDPYGSKDSTVFTLIVNNNFAPTIDSIADYTLNENDSITIALTAHDQNSGDVLHWSVSHAPKTAYLIDNGNGHAQLVLHPNYLSAGTYNTAVTVSDGKGGITTRTFNVTVRDVNPNTNVYVRFQYADTIGAPWNSITGLTTNNLIDASGKTTNIGLKLNTSWFATSDQGPSTGNNSGVYPDAVLKDYYYFGIYGGPDAVSSTITALDTSKLYNLTFYAGSNFAGADNNGSTIFTIGNKSDTLAVQNNTKNTITFKNVKPASNGDIIFSMSKNWDAQAGFLNALVISSLYDDGTKPASATALTAQNTSGGVKLTWADAAYNETGYKIWRSLASNKNFAVIAKTQSEASQFLDTTVSGNTEYIYKVQAFNNNGNSNYSNKVNIITLNKVPKLTSINNITVNNNATATIQIKATDDSDDHIILSTSGLPSFATLTDNGNGTGKIVITPAANNLGLFTVTVIATDKSNASDSTSFTVLIKDPNISSTYLSFSNGLHALPSPWNLVNVYPNAGESSTNFIDDNNDTTGITLMYENSLEGIIESGMQPVEGVGIYPNIIMKTAIYDGSSNNDTIQLSGLSKSKKYNFVFFNSHDGGLNATTNFTIGKTTLTLNATYNKDKTVQINGISPNASGIVNIIVSKAANADYSFLTALIIQNYDTSYKKIAPANLRLKNVTTNSISLIWQDRSSSESKYEIWRAADGAQDYTLIGTVPHNVRTFTDSNLASNKTYNYAVRAVFGNSYSDFSNTITVSTYAYNVYLNVTSATDAKLPWNNLNAVPQNGFIWNNFFDEKGMITGTGMQLNTELVGLYYAGMDTKRNSGIYPDNVLRESYGFFPGQTESFEITGLNLNMKYDFTFFASSQTYGDVSAAYIINGDTTILNASLNINGTQTIYGVTPDEYGNVTITVLPGSSNSEFGLISALVIGVYTPSSSNVIPTLPQTQQPEFTYSNKQMAISNENKSENNIENFIAFPNPFHDYLTLTIHSKTNAGKLQVIMYDVKGNAVYSNVFANVQKENTVKIILNNNLPAGIYTIVVTDVDTKKMKTIKVIKQ